MDILRTVMLSPGGRPIIRVNLADPAGLTVYTERSTFNILPPAKTQNWARSTRKSAGAVQSGESTDNWTALASWWIKGAGVASTVLQNAEALIAELDDVQQLNPAQPKLLEWRPDGALNSGFYEIRGSGLYVPHYDWAAFTGAQMLKLDMSWPISPIAQGLPLDIVDPFDVDSTQDYSVDVGGRLVFEPAVPGALYGSIAVSLPLVDEQTVRHTGRGYTYGDVQVTVGYQTEIGVPTNLGVMSSVINPANYLLVQLQAAGSLGIWTKTSGVLTLLQSAATLPIQPNTAYWLRVREEGNLVTGELFLTPPTPLSTPAVTVSTVLAAANAGLFGQANGIAAQGQAGWRVTEMTGDIDVTYFDACPYTYRARNLPAVFDLLSVPGTASPMLDVQVTSGSIPISPPIAVSATIIAGGGAWPLTGFYHYMICAYNQQGQTTASNEISVVVTATSQQVQVTTNLVVDAAGYNIYRTVAGGLPGTEMLIMSIPTNLSYIAANQIVILDSGVGALGGTTILPPTQNTAFRSIPTWALLAWNRKPGNFNRVWNGDFQQNIKGWTVNGGAASWSSSNPYSGTGNLRWTTPASQPVNVSFSIHRRFRAGVTYTVACQAASPGITSSITAIDGGTFAAAGSTLIDGGTPAVPGSALQSVDGGAAAATLAGSDSPNLACYGYQNGMLAAAYTWTGAPVALANNYQLYSLTFTPVQDFDTLTLQFVHTAATAGTIDIDVVTCYETAVPPTTPTQQQGRGGYPPFGIMDGANCIPADITTTGAGTVATLGQSPSGALNGTNSTWRIVTAGGPGSLVFDWWIDPHLLATPDDFARGTIAIETYWRGAIPPSVPAPTGDNFIQNPRVIISAITDPLTGSATERFTQEFGNQGRPLTQIAQGSDTTYNTGQLSRLGVIVLPVNQANPVRWKLKATHVWSGGITTMGGQSTFNMDYLLLVPAYRRACGPTGKSRVDGFYPAWQQVGGGIIATKTIRSSLRGRIAVPTVLPVNDAEDTGLTGTPLELQAPPGHQPGVQDHQMLVKLSDIVPDDPSGENVEQTTYRSTVHAAITPRYRLTRSS